MRATRADVELSDVNGDARTLGGGTYASEVESKSTEESIFLSTIATPRTCRMKHAHCSNTPALALAENHSEFVAILKRLWSSARHLCVFLILTFMHALALLVFKLNAVDGEYPFSPASSLVLSESLKLFIATLLHQRELSFVEGGPINLAESFRRTGSLKLWMASTTISMMYTANNLLSFFAVAKMEPGTLAIAKALVPYLTAVVLLCFGRSVKSLQWACIVLQCTGVAMTQYKDGGTAVYSVGMYLLLGLSVVITTSSSVFNEQIIKR